MGHLGLDCAKLAHGRQRLCGQIASDLSVHNLLMCGTDPFPFSFWARKDGHAA